MYIGIWKKKLINYYGHGVHMFDSVMWTFCFYFIIFEERKINGIWGNLT
jgi:hypothetical protein